MAKREREKEFILLESERERERAFVCCKRKCKSCMRGCLQCDSSRENNKIEQIQDIQQANHNKIPPKIYKEKMCFMKGRDTTNGSK